MQNQAQPIQPNQPPQVFRVRLGNGMFALVDEDDLDRVSPYRWQYVAGYATANINGKRQYMHRLLLEDLLAPGNGGHKMVVDHVNMNKLDNRLGNLRVCTTAQNLANRGKNANNTSGYKGVSYVPKSGKFKAQIKAIRVIYLGCFDTAIEAARAYDAAAIIHHGEYANHNNA